MPRGRGADAARRDPYRQFDLAEWLTGSAIESLYASIHEQLAANVILRLADGAICSVEAGVALPPGTPVKIAMN